jgi:hypothetical protein
MPVQDATGESLPRSAWQAVTEACAFFVEIAMLAAVIVFSLTRLVPARQRHTA